MSIWTMGINQSTHGSDGVVGINNLNLITGNIGKPGGTIFQSLANAMRWVRASGLPALAYPVIVLGKTRTPRRNCASFGVLILSFSPKIGPERNRYFSCD